MRPLHEQILPELSRVLRPRGTLLIVVKMADGEPGNFTAACGDCKVRLSTACWHELLDGAGLALTRSAPMMAGAGREAWQAAGAPWLFEANRI